jgi:hypothetical protein
VEFFFRRAFRNEPGQANLIFAKEAFSRAFHFSVPIRFRAMTSPPFMAIPQKKFVGKRERAEKLK